MLVAGLKPSFRFSRAGSNGTPLAVAGKAPSGKSRRMPVAVSASAIWYSALGHGVRQPTPPIGLHSGGVPSPPPPQAATGRRITARYLMGDLLLYAGP